MVYCKQKYIIVKKKSVSDKTKFQIAITIKTITIIITMEYAAGMFWLQILKQSLLHLLVCPSCLPSGVY